MTFTGSAQKRGPSECKWIGEHCATGAPFFWSPGIVHLGIYLAEVEARTKLCKPDIADMLLEGIEDGNPHLHELCLPVVDKGAQSRLLYSCFRKVHGIDVIQLSGYIVYKGVAAATWR